MFLCSAGEVQKFDPLRKGPSKHLKKPAKGMEFNPLPERARKAAASSQASGQLDRKPEATFGAVPPDVSDMDEELKKGLEQLMKELAEGEQQVFVPRLTLERSQSLPISQVKGDCFCCWLLKRERHSKNAKAALHAANDRSLSACFDEVSTFSLGGLTSTAPTPRGGRTAGAQFC